MQENWPGSPDIEKPHFNLRHILNAPSSRIGLLDKASRQTLLTGVILAAVFMAFLAAVQFSTPDLADNDGFYHIKMAYLMRTEGLKPEFTWLPLTILNPRQFYDHHFLFHVALIPFTFGDLVQGAKWGSVLFSSLAFLAVWRLLKNQGVPYSSLWAVGLLAVSEAFIYRMSIPRAQSLSLAALAVGLDWLLRKKYRRLFFLGFFFVWLYNAFPLLAALAGIYVLAVWMIEGQLDLRPLLFSLAGILAGLLFNPYFPYNIIFSLNHFLPKLFEATSISVGNEWYPYDTAQLLKNSPGALLAVVSGILALGLSGKRMDVRTLTGFGLVVLFAGMLFSARRFIEYFPAFALIFAASAWHPLLDELKNKIQVSSPTWKDPIRRNLAPILLVLVLVPGIFFTLRAGRASLQNSNSYQMFAGASAWLSANTPAGSRVFQTDWDDFPRLFFYNTHNTYLVGLDPTYLQLADSNLYDSWVMITQGKIQQPSRLIATTFGARYVLTDLKHGAFLSQVRRDPGLRQVYEDQDAVVFELQD